MTELITIERFKPNSSDKSFDESDFEDDDDDSVTDNDTVIVAKVNSKKSAAKRSHRINARLPLIISTKTQPQRKKKHVQNIRIIKESSRPSKELILKKTIDLAQPKIQYVGIPMPAERIVRTLTPTMERSIVLRSVPTPVPILRSVASTPIYERPVVYRTRPTLIRARQSDANTLNVQLPKHARALVNKFLSTMQSAHGYTTDDSSDCSVCSNIKSKISRKKIRHHRRCRKSKYFELDDSDRDDISRHKVVFRSQDSPIRIYRNSRSHDRNCHGCKHCQVCDLLDNSDFSIESNRERLRNVGSEPIHQVESFVSNVNQAKKTGNPVISTIQTTATHEVTDPRTHSVLLPAPLPPNQYYSNYPYSAPVMDQTIPYDMPYGWEPSAYDAMWQYDPSIGAMPGYPTDQTYYNNTIDPGYVQTSNLSMPQYKMYTTPYQTMPYVESTIPITNFTNTVKRSPLTNGSNNQYIDKATLTRIDDKQRILSPTKSSRTTNKTIIVHNNHPRPKQENIIIEKQVPIGAKIEATTILKERSTQTPRAY